MAGARGAARAGIGWGPLLRTDAALGTVELAHGMLWLLGIQVSSVRTVGVLQTWFCVFGSGLKVALIVICHVL